MFRLKQNKLILAFPGMGKTPLSYKRANYRDVDFGTYRSGRKVRKEDEGRILPEFANYLSELDKIWARTTIMTNEPKLADYIMIDRMYIPSNESAAAYCAKKMGVDVDTVMQWVQDWVSIAHKHGIPVIPVSSGLDHYLLKTRVSPRKYMLPAIKDKR